MWGFCSPRVESSPWPGVEPGVVGEDVEQAGLHVVEKRGEVRWGAGFADAAGEQSIALTVNYSSSSLHGHVAHPTWPKSA
jgi:hypothetical protein